MADYGGSTGAAIRIFDGTNNVYIDTTSWECECKRDDSINHIAGGISYSTRIGERTQWVRVTGDLIFDTNVGVTAAKEALDTWKLGNVAPVSIEIIDADGNYIRFHDNTSTTAVPSLQNYLKGYVITSPIRFQKFKYTIRLFFEECWQ